jgi:hypothetical protein
MSTFPAKYGWLGIDITARLLEHATETADSLSAKNVDLPSGDHSITVSISDSAGRTGSRVLRLSVVSNGSSAPPDRSGVPIGCYGDARISFFARMIVENLILIDKSALKCYFRMAAGSCLRDVELRNF